MFAVHAVCLPESVVDINDNVNYLPKEGFVGEWMAIPLKTKGGFFAL